MHSDIAIIGGGPAGLTAGLYAARGGASVTLYEELFPGGQIAKTPLVENYPGFPDGVVGYEVGSLLQKQAEKFGLKVEYAGATGLILEENPKRILLPDREDTAKAVILCMGAHARSLGVPREEMLTGAGVSYCATCDGAFFKEKAVAVVGGGDTAMEDALYLSRMAAQVTVIHRRDAFRASKIMSDRVLSASNIDVVWNAVIEEVLDPVKNEVTGLRLKNVKTGERFERAVQGVFIAIGHTPNTAAFAGQIDLDAEGYIVTTDTKTSKPGVFAAGDVQDRHYKQAVTAAGTGCMAALEAERFLTANG